MSYTVDEMPHQLGHHDLTLTCSIGVMAYNEAANVGRLVEALLDQKTTSCVITEIIVLCSGCTDGTEAVIRDISARHPLVKLVVQARREGKASAINLFLRHSRSDILVLESADTLPEPTTIQRLVEPFADPDVGMTGGHPKPVNNPDTFMGFAVHLLWELHHQIACQHPKLGELTSFRRIFHRLPLDSAVDEANMEPLVLGQGYQLRYVPDAVVHNRGPETVNDFLKQRRRINAGHLKVRRTQAYAVSTMKGSRIVKALMHTWRWEWRFLLWTPGVIGLEVYARFLGWVDVRRKRSHAVWDIAETTKGMVG